VTSIQETEGYWNSTIAHPALQDRGGDATTGYVGISHVAPHSVGYAATVYVGLSHVAPHSVGYAGPAEGTSVPTTNPCPLACQEARR
jgi:hypothetical protein